MYVYMCTCVFVGTRVCVAPEDGADGEDRGHLVEAAVNLNASSGDCGVQRAGQPAALGLGLDGRDLGFAWLTGAMAHLDPEKHKVVHRDLAARNVNILPLPVGGGTGEDLRGVKLTDFGMARAGSGPERLRQGAGQVDAGGWRPRQIQKKTFTPGYPCHRHVVVPGRLAC